MRMEIKTDRLSICSLREDDWAELKHIFSDFNHSKYAVYDRPLPTRDNDVQAFVKRFAESGLFFVVRLLSSGQMIGYICFHKDEGKYDLGYCFHSDYHSCGYAYESANAVIGHFIREYGVTFFTAGTAVDNIPSCRLLEKLGFTRISTESISFDDSFLFQSGNFVLNSKELNF